MWHGGNREREKHCVGGDKHDEDWYGLDRGGHQALDEIVKAFEQIAEFNRLTAHLCKQTQVQTAHHRTNQYDGHRAADQHGDQCEPQK